jgi:Na+/proline symporter
MAAMLAAAMSTLDSGINSLSAVWLKEFHQKFINKHPNDKAQVKISRWSSAAVGLFSVVTALFLSFSSQWFNQTFVEVATIFSAFDVITLPAFIFAVFSKRSNSRFVWMMAFFLWGLKFGMITWYSVTKRCSVLWHEGMPLGSVGAISPDWLYLALGITFLFMVLYFIRKSKWLGLSSLFFTGGTVSIGLWTMFSNYIDTDTPKVLSFQWVGFPVMIGFIVFGIIGLRFFKTQPVEKYMGLTFNTADKSVTQMLDND